MHAPTAHIDPTKSARRRAVELRRRRLRRDEHAADLRTPARLEFWPEEQKVACRAAGERRAVSNRGGHAGHLAQRRREERPLAARMGRARWGECARHPRHAEQLGVEGARVVRARRLDFGRGQIPGEGRAVRWPTGRARRPGCGRENWRPRRGDALLPPPREQLCSLPICSLRKPHSHVGVSVLRKKNWQLAARVRARLRCSSRRH